jgi:hypothetical protein
MIAGSPASNEILLSFQQFDLFGIGDPNVVQFLCLVSNYPLGSDRRLRSGFVG